MADAFMAGNERRLGLDRPVAMNGVKVGMADAARRDLDQDLSGPRVGTGTSSITSGLPNSCATAASSSSSLQHLHCPALKL
jgi:hypothetical protein